ncbi:CORD and CS domain-containing protein [Thecamonas trahens ATCC 50062]|uniref:CORD and CS domain-containing protein n=1 Tax=Thecamonas trahens ATCC 50062 TaxID=461836 RepID=A0A0L0DIX9_THETB|nr:CORD and CS domain-containing protein [Thecamonas trahens ATCC 50062]KNC52257.1 CORD and CS domain-containing protein [Thecamonas trahens ATCC 50062]|eukprot:XP_013762259.1 CORD and CS domain-containing protein [Thecamonas trahens ATCC 50062]
MSETPVCTRTNCGKLVDDGECAYHPAAPVFHERKRTWPCCNVSHTSFDDFLAVPGCTTGPHQVPGASSADGASKAGQARQPASGKVPRFYVHLDAEGVGKPVPDFTAVFELDPANTLRRIREDFVIQYNRQHGAEYTLKIATVRLVDGDGPAAAALDLDTPLPNVVTPGADVFCSVVTFQPIATPDAALTPNAASSSAEAAEATAAATAAAAEPRDPNAERTCLNYTCGGTFTDATNADDACTFHLAPPFFHDASQGYQCCSRVMSFDEFQAIPPCQTGPHSDMPHELRPVVPFPSTDDEVVFSQDKTTISLTFNLPGTDASGVDVDVEDDNIMVIISRSGEKDFVYTVDPLHAEVKPGKSSVAIDGDAVVITFTKASKAEWPALQG